MIRTLTVLVATVMTVACGLAVQGCGPKQPAAVAPEPDPATRPAGFFPRKNSSLIPQDPLPPQNEFIQMIAYKITMPAGSVSNNAEFWKHVSETAVDPGTHDLLWKNGVRAGVAPSSEWDFIKDILNQNPAITQPSAYSGREVKNVELELRMKVDYQNLFYFNALGDLIGRTYERADNLISLDFQPVPRKTGTVRLALCPVVRSMREVLVPVGEVNALSFKQVRPEQLYDLNLTADVPLDGFLVVAPSPEGKWPTSLGAIFLGEDGPAEQAESLLVFRPIVYRQRPENKSVAATRPAGL